MGETDWGVNWVFYWWAGLYSLSLESNFLLMGGAVFPPSYLTWGQTMVEIMKIMGPPSEGPIMHCCTQCPQPCSRPPPTHASTRDSWTLMGKSGSVSYGVTAPFSWVLCTRGFVCALQESVSPVLCKFWQVCDGVNGGLLQEGLCHTQIPRGPVPSVVHCWLVSPQETLKHSSLIVLYKVTVNTLWQKIILGHWINLLEVQWYTHK